MSIIHAIRIAVEIWKNAQPPTSYKFYWGGIADFKGLASNLALNGSTRKCFGIPTKTYMYVIHHCKK